MALRRVKQQEPASPTFALPIDLATGFDVRYLKAVRALSANQGQDPWRWYREIAEIHYAVSRGARTSGYAKLKAHKLEKDGTIGSVIDGGLPAEIASMLSSPYGGQRALSERYFTLRKVPGDCYLLRIREKPDGTGDVIGYDWAGATELNLAESETGSRRVDDGEQVYAPGQKIKRVVHPGIQGGGKLERLVQAQDFIGRSWRSTGEYVDQSDPPLASMRDECELLRLLTIGLKAKLRSRLALNGIAYIPNQINEVRSGAPVPSPDDPVFHENTVLDALIRAGTFAITNFEDPSSALPIFMTGPAEFAEAIKFIIMDREVYETDMALRAELISRILSGLDIEPESVKGMGDSNHWSSWSVEDSERRVNIQPEMESQCWALTRLVLHKAMLEAKLPQGRILNTVLWYDLTDANVKTNLAEDGRQLHDRFAIGDAALRRLNGIKEADAPSEIEKIRQFGQTNKVPYLAFYKMGEAEDIDWEKAQPAKTGPAPDAGGDKPKTGPGQDSGSPNKSPGNGPRRLKPA